MDTSINLASEIEKQLPAGLVDFIKTAGEVARSQGMGLYLVGGMVRDLFLSQANIDLDLVVEGNAIELARKLAEITKGSIVTHSRFNTATIKWDNWSVDLATARLETYPRPGALPTVKPGSIKDDLFRRDFAINAMAVCLIPGRYGEMIDLYGGIADLEKRLIRILHEKSFIDDATRIWRAIRYEQRFDFRIEPNTLELLKRNTGMLDTISGDRIRHELELALREKYPEKVLRRADELGVLVKLHPALKAGKWLAEKYEQARQGSLPSVPPVGLYMALLVYHLSDVEAEQLISCLRLNKSTAEIVSDTVNLKTRLDALNKPGLTPGGLYRLLRGYSLIAVKANLLAAGSDEAQRRILFYLDKLCSIKPVLTGEDLLRMGIPAGPRIKEILSKLLDARLDGKVATREDEEGMVREILSLG